MHMPTLADRRCHFRVAIGERLLTAQSLDEALGSAELAAAAANFR
jgi:hypothetical protein